jgi:hypothetical protein
MTQIKDLVGSVRGSSPRPVVAVSPPGLDRRLSAKSRFDFGRHRWFEEDDRAVADLSSGLIGRNIIR